MGAITRLGRAFLPSVFQGVQCRSKGDPILYSSNPIGMNRSARRKSLDALADLNRLQLSEMGHPATQARIAQYELAFRMQASVPEVMDISRESAQTLKPMEPSPECPVWPITVCSPGAWRRLTSVSFNFSTGGGIFTEPPRKPESRMDSPVSAPPWTNRFPP